MKTKNKNLIWIFLLGVFLPELVWGAPVIESISGTLGNGQSITVYGSGFGSKDQARPQLWDTVDNQVTYQALTDGILCTRTHRCDKVFRQVFEG